MGLLEEGKVASNAVPSSRFNFAGHWDGSRKPGTMRPAGGMFLSEQDVDLANFDAAFFEMGGAEALATDPNQRQMLEIVYEGLESAGIPMDAINGRDVACFVASFAVDYADIHGRDPEDRPGNTGLGVGARHPREPHQLVLQPQGAQRHRRYGLFGQPHRPRPGGSRATVA